MRDGGGGEKMSLFSRWFNNFIIDCSLLRMRFQETTYFRLPMMAESHYQLKETLWLSVKLEFSVILLKIILNTVRDDAKYDANLQARKSRVYLRKSIVCKNQILHKSMLQYAFRMIV